MKLFEILTEAKSTFDFRHENTLKDIEYWPAKQDHKYIDPKDGFHFAYSGGVLLLYSTDNQTYSKFVSDPRAKKFFGKKFDHKAIRELTHGKGPDLWNQMGGVVDLKAKLITISKEDVDGKNRQRVISDIKDFQQALRSLSKYGLTNDFKIKGTAAPINGKTVQEVMNMINPVDAVFGSKAVTFYHGTSASRAEVIKSKGLQPNKAGDVYVDLIPGYSEHNVYLATDPKTAEFYGKRQAKKDGDETYVVFKIDVPDKAKIVADDAFVHLAGKVDGSHPAAIKSGLKNISSVGYKGRILPKFVSVISTKKA